LRGAPTSRSLRETQGHENLGDSQGHQARNGSSRGSSGSFICDDTGCSGSFTLPGKRARQVEQAAALKALEDVDQDTELGESLDPSAAGQKLADIPFAALFGNLQGQLQRDSSQLGDSESTKSEVTHRARHHTQTRHREAVHRQAEGRLMHDINSQLASAQSSSARSTDQVPRSTLPAVSNLWHRLNGVSRITQPSLSLHEADQTLRNLKRDSAKTFDTPSAHLSLSRVASQADGAITSAQLRNAKLAQHSAEALAHSAEQRAEHVEEQLRKFRQRRADSRIVAIPSLSKAKRAVSQSAARLEIVEQHGAKIKADKQKHAMEQMEQMEQSLGRHAAHKGTKQPLGEVATPAATTQSIEQQAVALAEHASSSSDFAQFEKAAAMLMAPSMDEAVTLMQEAEDSNKTRSIPSQKATALIQKQHRASQARISALKERHQQDREQHEKEHDRKDQEVSLPSEAVLMANTKSTRKQNEEADAAHKLDAFIRQLSNVKLQDWQPSAGIPSTGALLPETEKAFKRVEAHQASLEATQAAAQITMLTDRASQSSQKMVSEEAPSQPAPNNTHKSATASNIETRLKAADARFSRLMHHKKVTRKEQKGSHQLGESIAAPQKSEVARIRKQLKAADARFDRLMHTKATNNRLHLGESSAIENSNVQSLANGAKGKNPAPKVPAADRHTKTVTSTYGMQLMPASQALTKWRKMHRPSPTKRHAAASIQHQKLDAQQKRLESLKHSTSELKSLLDPAAKSSSQLAATAAAEARRLEAAAAIANIRAQRSRSMIRDTQQQPNQSKQSDGSSNQESNRNQRDLAIKNPQ